MTLRRLLAGPLRAGLQALAPLRPAADGFRVLLFHDVPDDAIPGFRALVSYVAQNHGVLTPAEAAQWLEGRPPARTPASRRRMPCLFTFDDGFASNFKIAETVLAEHGVKAVFFVNPGLIDLDGERQREAVARLIFQGRRAAAYLPDEQRLMTWPELAGLAQSGHVVGCHGMSHRRLSELDGAELEREVDAAGELLDARLGQSTAWYAYAFGDIGSIDANAFGRVAKRFRYCRSGLRGANTAATPALALNADSMAPAAPDAYQKLLLEGGLDFRYAERRRRLLGMAATPPAAPA